MKTKEKIIQIGDGLIREKGYNAFSFSDISKELNIKNASVHYHFPTKTALGVAIVQKHIKGLENLLWECEQKTPEEKLTAFLNIYENVKSENRICIVGALLTDLYTVDVLVQNELKKLMDKITHWVTQFLEEGKNNGMFQFSIDAKAKALMMTTNMLAAVQITRLGKNEDFQIIRQTIINDLIQQEL